MGLRFNSETLDAIRRFEALPEAEKIAAMKAAGIPFDRTIRFELPKIPTADELLAKLSAMFHALTPAQRLQVIQLAAEYHASNERMI